jgi:hypothetical protein
MAIGDTVQAGLLRADFSPIERGGAAKGRAYRAIGEGIGSALDKFAKNKQEGEAAEMGINAMIAGMDDQQKEELLSGESKLGKTYNKFLDGELSNSQKKAFLGGLATYNTTYRQNMADQMAMDKFAIEQAKARRDEITFNRDQQNLINENQFMQSLMSQIASPQAQRQADIAMPGLAALGNGDARNRFMQAQLQQPQNQVPVSSLGSQDFGRFASREGLDPKLSVARMEALRQAELASQPKPMSDKELEELIKLRLANQKALKESGLPVLTEGEQVIDELVAKEYTEYVNLGGKSAVQSKIKKLNKAIQDLEGSDDLNSWLTGVLPESMKALFNEKGLSVQQAVESVIQENLRETLGAQFAQKEGEMFMARGYDAKLSDEVNIERVKSLLKEIEDRASARTQTFDYFNKNKTMKGYDGPVFNESTQPSPSSSFDPQEIDRLYEEKMRLGKARGLR